MTLEHGWAITTMLAVAVVSIGLVCYFYRWNFRQLDLGQRRKLLGLRCTAILLVVLLLFRPVASFERNLLERRGLVFAIDSSASMGTADDATGQTRLEQVKSRVTQWWSKLERDYELSAMEFSDHAVPLESVHTVNGLEPTGKATSLTRAVVAAARSQQRSGLEAVLLFSDGVNNAAGDPVAAARKLGLVVHTIGVGSSLRDSSSYRDIQVTGMDCPDRMTLNNRARVKAFVDAVGLAGRVIKVTLEQDDQQVAESELVLDGIDGPQEVTFEYLPTVKGRHNITARVTPVGEERIEQNNHRSATTMVVEARLRVLYVEGTLRAEYGALVDRFLSKDPDVEFCALVQTRPGVFLQRSNIAGLDLRGIPTDPALLQTFSVIVLGDLDVAFMKPEVMELLVQRVRDGAGLVVLGGYHSLGPGGYAGSLLEEVLPVFVGPRDIGQVPDPFLPVLTPDGRQHPIFANIATFFPQGSAEPELPGLPPLEGCVRVLGAKPGATVLAHWPGDAGAAAAPMPVLAVQPVGKGRTAVFTGDTTRNWQQTLKALDQESPFLRFWGQMARWLAGRTEEIKKEAGIVASVDKVAYEPGSPVTVNAVVRDSEGEGSDRAVVTARIRYKGARQEEQLNLSATDGPAGHYGTSFEPRQTGIYEITVDARVDDLVLTADPMTIEVGRPNLEFDRLDLDEKLLGRLASESGGLYSHISTADRLLEQLERKQEKRRVYAEQPLYWPPLFWSLFVTVLTVEWVLRKRYQMR